MTIVDFSEYPQTADMFSGAEKKICILVGGQRYLLKFQKIDQFKPRYNHVSEHIGSGVHDGRTRRTAHFTGQVQR